MDTVHAGAAVMHSILVRAMPEPCPSSGLLRGWSELEEGAEGCSPF